MEVDEADEEMMEEDMGGQEEFLSTAQTYSAEIETSAQAGALGGPGGESSRS